MTVDKSDAESERKKTNNKKPRASEQAVTEQNGTTDYIGTDPMWEFVYAYLNLLKHTGVKYDKGFCRRYE